MNWREIEISCIKDLEEQIYAVLYQYPITSIEIMDYQDVLDFKKNQPYWVVIDEDYIEPQENIMIKTYLEETDELPSLLEEIKISLEKLSLDNPSSIEFRIDKSIEDQDWSMEWKKGYKPIKISERLVIKPTWENYQREKDEIILEMDPGMAFGTGTHETTSLSLKEIESIDIANKTVLDIGCGSGILSIAALLFGASEVLAIDIDPLAVKATIENAVINGVDKKLTVREENILESTSNHSKYDVIISNTLFPIIKGIVPSIGKYLGRGGIFICSGLLDIQKDEICRDLRDRSFSIIHSNTDGEWASILAVKRDV